MNIDLRDNRDPELIGVSLAAISRQKPEGTSLSALLDDMPPSALASVPNYGTVEAREERSRHNGDLSKANKHFAPRSAVESARAADSPPSAG